MNLLDLYEQREPYQQAIDKLEQSRIDDLHSRMDDLVARAKQATDPAHKAALVKEFQKYKAERDSYYSIREGSVTRTATGLRYQADPGRYGGYEPEPELKGLNKTLTKNLEKGMGIEFKKGGQHNRVQPDVDENGIPGNVPTEKIPGKEDLLKGRGRTYYENQKKNSEPVDEHGGGIGPKQRWQDLMPEQMNPEDDDWYDDEEETDLRTGDYVRDTQDGEYGEIFRMVGDPYERRVRILDRDDRGWYIEPSRLTRVDPQDPDVQLYFGKKRRRDMDEASYTPTAGELARDLIKMPDSDFNKKYGMSKQQANRYYSSSKLKDPGVAEAQKTDNRPASQFDREIVKAQPDGSCELKCGHKTSAKLSKNPVGKKIFCARCYELRNKEQGVTEGDDHPYDRGLEDGLAGKEYNDSMYSSYEDKESYRRGRIVAKQQAKKGVAEGENQEYTVRVVDEEGSGYTVKVTATSEQGALHKAIVKVRNSGARPEHARIIRQGVAEADETSWTANSAQFRKEEDMSWPVKITLEPNADINQGRGRQVKTMTVTGQSRDAAKKKLVDYYRKNGWTVTGIKFTGDLDEARRVKGGDYQLKLVDKQSDDDTDLDDVVMDYYFDVYQNGQKIGTAEGDSYYGELVVKPEFDRQFKLSSFHDKDHPLMQQFEKIQQQGVTEGDDLGHLDAEVFGRIDKEKQRKADLKKNDPAAYAKELEKDSKNYGRGIMGVLRRKYDQPIDETATAPIIVPKRRAKAKPEPKFNIPYSADDYVPPALAMASAEALDRIIADPSTRETTRELAKKARAEKKKGVAEGWSDAIVSRRTGRPRTPYSVYIKGKKWKDFANDDHARAVMDKLKAKFRADGRDPETVTIAPTDIPESVTEDQDTSGVEQAILKRIMVAHLDLLRQYGPEKVMQAAEEVAYNVGDVDEIGTSDVSAYVNQVKQILGAVQEGLRDPEDNPCWKGYHPVGTKKKNGQTVPNCVPNADK
jgi:hypothetical protein